MKNGFQARMNAVNDKDGNLLVNEEQVQERWREYFNELLNRPEPSSPVEDQQIMEEGVDDLTENEVKNVIRKLNNNKASGID